MQSFQALIVLSRESIIEFLHQESLMHRKITHNALWYVLSASLHDSFKLTSIVTSYFILSYFHPFYMKYLGS